MGKLVNLTVHRNTLEKRKRRECYDYLKKCAKENYKDMDGFVLVSFRNNQDSTYTPRVNYSCLDAKDVNKLPEMAKIEITMALIKNRD